MESLQGGCSRRGDLEAVVRYFRVFAPSFSPGGSSFVAIRPQGALWGGLRGVRPPQRGVGKRLGVLSAAQGKQRF